MRAPPTPITIATRPGRLARHPRGRAGSGAGGNVGATANGADASAPSQDARVTWSGYAEVFYQWHANDPSNGITNFRGFTLGMMTWF